MGVVNIQVIKKKQKDAKKAYRGVSKWINIQIKKRSNGSRSR